MFYSLNDNVYLVKGAAKSCIYDFNLSKLYSISNLLADKIETVNQGSVAFLSQENRETVPDKELQEIFEKLLKMGVFVLTETPVCREIKEIKKEERRLRYAWIEITDKCNLKCRHCYNESNACREKVMPIERYQRVIDGVEKMGIRKIQLIGGEPFFDAASLRRMLDYTVGKFESVEIFTNGMLIGQEWMEYLAKNRIRIALSVYSYQEDVHDEVTGCRGSWSRTNRTIELLKEHGIKYRVCNVLMKDVAIGDKNTDLYELHEDKDIVRMSGRADFSLLSDELIRKKLIRQKTFEKPLNKKLSESLVSGHNCFAHKIYISVDGIVYPCVMERRLQHGEIVKEGIPLDDSILHFNKDQVKGCCECEYRYTCFDCRPNSLGTDLREKPWYCTYDPLHGEWEDEESFLERLHEKWDVTSSDKPAAGFKNGLL